MTSAQHQTRLAALDVLRGLAIVLVLVNHMPGGDIHSFLISALRSFGWSGVDLFFVLSGYLISSLLFRELNETGSLDVGRFLLRRGLKIWPSYYVAYGAVVVSHTISLAVHGHSDEITALILPQWPNIIFIQNYCSASIRWTHSWSLAVEEHFYLILPLLLLIFWKSDRRRWVPITCAIVGLSVLIARIALAGTASRSWEEFYYPTHLRADSLAFGVLIAYVQMSQADLFRRIASRCRFLTPVLLLVPVLTVVFPRESSSFMPTVGFTLLYLAYGIPVVAGANYATIFSSGAFRPLAKVFCFLGRYSYTIYLAHSVVFQLSGATPVTSFVRRIGGAWTECAFFFVVSVGAGVLLSWSIEQPMLAFRERWIPTHRMSRSLRFRAAATA